MSQSYFIWKNEDCRAKGVKLQGPVPIVWPEERVKHVEIPGRSGDLTETEGDQIYNSYIQTATIMVHGAYLAGEIKNWLKGRGFVTFHGEPDKKQEARIIGAVTLGRHSYNHDWWVGDVQFYCQPLKQLLTEAPVTITSSGSAVVNAGDVPSRPRITVTASSTSMTVTICGKTLTLTGITSGKDYVIDCDTMEVSLTENNVTTLVTNKSIGDFPTLAPGSNTVTGSGWSKLVFEKRERFL